MENNYPIYFPPLPINCIPFYFSPPYTVVQQIANCKLCHGDHNLLLCQLWCKNYRCLAEKQIHYKSNCSRMEEKCTICHNLGHYTRECPYSQDICKKCNSASNRHLKIECPETTSHQKN